MLSVVLFLILAWSFYIGFSRGLVLQGFYSLGSILATVFATSVYQSWSKVISLWVPFINATQGSKSLFYAQTYIFRLSEIFYAGLAFLLAYTVFYCFWRLVGIFVHFLPEKWNNFKGSKWIAGALAVYVTAYSLQIFLTTMAAIPMDVIQDQLNRSVLASMLIRYMPFTTSFLKGLFVTKIIG